jgi:hypothetical protein
MYNPRRKAIARARFRVRGSKGKLRKKLRARKRDACPTQLRPRNGTPRPHPEAQTHLWSEALVAAEILLLHATPVYYGFGIPHGDGSGVVIIPGFLGTDLYLMELHGWLGRIGYRPYFSGIGINADCPNLLIKRHLNETVEKALDETGGRTAAERRCIGDHVGVSHSWDGCEPHDYSRSRSGAPSHSRRAWRWGPSPLLHRRLHLPVCGSSSPNRS